MDNVRSISPVYGLSPLFERYIKRKVSAECCQWNSSDPGGGPEIRVASNDIQRGTPHSWEYKKTAYEREGNAFSLGMSAAVWCDSPIGERTWLGTMLLD